MSENLNEVLWKLQEPFEEKEEWTWEEYGKKRFFWSAHIQRLDEVVGPDRWSQSNGGIARRKCSLHN